MSIRHTVKATREGLVGSKTSLGWAIDTVFPFVALPSVRALRRLVTVTNPLNGKSCLAVVMDVGPWNTHDDLYVFDTSRPQAETGTDMFGRTTNHAGIDLGERVWALLEMTDNAQVVWEFY